MQAAQAAQGAMQVMFRAVALDKLTFPLQGMCVNPEVARRLPFELACRYQALPVAEDDGHLTVAMAHPDDMEARQAILAALPLTNPRRSDPRSPADRDPAGMLACPATALCPPYPRSRASAPSEVDTRGMSVYLVRGDPVIIDSLLADVWPGRARRALRMLVVDATQNQVGSDHARALGRLLGAEISTITGDHAASQSRPGPVRRLLLVIQSNDEPADSAALACAVRLARLSGATVTVLAVVRTGPENGLAALLTTQSTAVGQAAQRLVEAGITATLRLRQGSLDCQLHREVIETDYDVMLIDSRPVLPFGHQGAGQVPEAMWGGVGAVDQIRSRTKETDYVGEMYS